MLIEVQVWGLAHVSSQYERGGDCALADFAGFEYRNDAREIVGVAENVFYARIDNLFKTVVESTSLTS